MICPYCHKEIEPVEETTNFVNVIKDHEGRVQIWTEETRDIDNILISKRVDNYNYAKKGDIDTINQQIFDGEATLLSEKTIQHFEDGRQPVVEEIRGEHAV